MYVHLYFHILDIEPYGFYLHPKDFIGGGLYSRPPHMLHMLLLDQRRLPKRIIIRIRMKRMQQA